MFPCGNAAKIKIVAAEKLNDLALPNLTLAGAVEFVAEFPKLPSHHLVQHSSSP
jgi:hypothetical protein